MITAAVIICALLIGLLENKYLFVKPITAEKILVIILLTGTAIFSFFKEKSNNDQVDRIEHNSDSLKVDNKILAAGNKMLSNQIDSLSSSSKYYYTNTVEILAKYGYKVDTYNHRLEKLALGSAKDLPSIMIYVNDIKYKKYVDSATFDIKLSNRGGSIAYNLDFQLDLVLDNNGHLISPPNGLGKLATKTLPISDWKNATCPVAFTGDIDKAVKYIAVKGVYYSMSGVKCNYYEMFMSTDNSTWSEVTATSYEPRILNYLKQIHRYK
jgi:hypothetical protein